MPHILDMNRIDTALRAELARRGDYTVRSAQGLSLADASAIAACAEACARKVGVPVCISVADADGRQILFHRMEGSLPASSQLATAKAWTAASYRMGSDELGRLAQPGGMLFGVGATGGGQAVLFGGGLPCRAGGAVIGAIGISGGTVDEDMQIARHALDGFSEARAMALKEGTGL
jgi:uncharacterized protein GlcG (DUF336 family)